MPTKTAKKPTRPVKVVRKPVKPVKKPVKAPLTPKVPVAVPLPPPVPVPVVVQPPKSEADKMWEEIQNLPIAMFGLPGQTVGMHVTPINVDPTKLFLVIRSSATLPSLEESLKGRFNVELADKYVIVTRVPPPIVPRKR